MSRLCKGNRVQLDVILHEYMETHGKGKKCGKGLSERDQWLSRVGYERTQTLNQAETSCAPATFERAFVLLVVTRTLRYVCNQGCFGVRNGRSIRIPSLQIRGPWHFHRNPGVQTFINRFCGWR